MNRKLVNFLAFQTGWFACVLGAANGMPWSGLLVAAFLLLLHLASVEQPGGELRLVVLAVLMGAIFDSLLAASGWLRYPNGTLVPGTAPYWILAMWAMFATTLNRSMNWLQGRVVLAALLGAVFGPLSYMAGARLGGLQFIDLVASLIALGIGWAIAMPLLMLAAGRVHGHLDTASSLATRSAPRGER